MKVLRITTRKFMTSGQEGAVESRSYSVVDA